MVNRVHDHPSNVRKLSEPSLPPGFTEADILMVEISHLTNCRPTLLKYFSNFTGRQSYKSIAVFFGH
jgi:hypothetical protein